MHRKFRMSFRIFSVSTYNMSLNLSKTIDTAVWSSIACSTNNPVIFDAYKGLVINNIFTKDVTTIITILETGKMR